MFFLTLLLTPLNDVTTTPQAPPAFVEILKLEANHGRDMSYSPDSRERQQKLYPDLSPLPLKGSAIEIFKKVQALAAKQVGWTLIHADETAFRIEATASTALLKFIDDVVIELRPVQGQSSDLESTHELHMRSKSRIGRSDLGANAKRIREFLAQLHTL